MTNVPVELLPVAALSQDVCDAAQMLMQMVGESSLNVVSFVQE